jgi:hypothetical protein
MVDRKTRACKAKTAAGSPCSAQPVRPDGFCFWHSPEAATERAEARRRGGEHRSNRVRAAKAAPPAMSTDDLLATLSEAIRRVEAGELEPGVVNAMANLARAMDAIRESSEIEQRISALESRAGLNVGTPWRA